MRQAIRKRLRIDPQFSSGEMDVAFAAQVAMLMYAGAAVIAVAMAMWPMDDAVNQQACVVIGLFSVAGSAAWFVIFDRAPVWYVYAATWAAVALTFVGTKINGQDGLEAVLLVLWIVLYAFLFFPRQIAMLFLLTACTGVGILLFSDGEWQANISRWLTATLTLTAVGTAVGALRARLIANLEQAQGHARTDELTGLPNRRALLADLDAALADGRPRCLVLFDLNGFKRVNDELGHPEGDALLARLGARLAETTESQATAYRLGGDEFCILSGVDAELDLALVAGALAETDHGLTVTAAYGAVDIPSEARSPSSALSLADRRMYADKALAVRPAAAPRSADAAAANA
ncbi:MAG: GGDEF domain-containing protein [Solirubrobacteraceae bacterium]|nr:GGDEF domain-containing protein [Solirubrobacteraceae bacterium]